MTRWITMGATALGFALVLLAKGPGMLGLGLLLALAGLFATVMVLASERISSRSRPESAMLSPEVLAAIRERAAADKRQAAAQSTRPQPPPAAAR